MLNTYAALGQFAPSAINNETNNAQKNLVINTPLNTTIPVGGGVLGYNANSVINGKFWDEDQVQGTNGTVDYLLGNIVNAPLRATLIWNAVSNGNSETLSGVQLYLYQEGTNNGNPAGDPDGTHAGDQLIATGSDENGTQLFDFTVPQVSNGAGYYLEVQDNNATPVTFALAVSVPEPTGLALMGFALSGLLVRRKRK
jgi:hypothetical protein